MKLVAFLILIGTALTLTAAKLKPTELSAESAAARWGQLKFDAGQFKSGDYSIRSKMATDLVTSNRFYGKSVKDVWEELGRHDGYYKNDVVPAYILNDDLDDIWQLVFIVNADRNVIKTVIYKNCCEK